MSAVAEMTQYILEVPDDLWEEYKDTVPRSEQLDGPIVEFIENRVENSNRVAEQADEKQSGDSDDN